MFGFHKCGSGMGTGKVERKSFAWFCIFKLKISKTLCDIPENLPNKSHARVLQVDWLIV